MVNKKMEEAYYGESEPERTWFDLLIDYLKEKKYGKGEKLKKDVGV
jgi:hypothetical protein